MTVFTKNHHFDYFWSNIWIVDLNVYGSVVYVSYSGQIQNSMFYIPTKDFFAILYQKLQILPYLAK